MDAIQRLSNSRTAGNVRQAIGTARSTMDSIVSRFSGFAGDVQNFVEGSTFVGMNWALAEKIYDAVDEYCRSLEEIAAQLDDRADAAQSFAGTELLKSIQEYLSAIKYMTNAWCSQLRKYNETVKYAIEEYQKSHTDLASNVSTGAQSLESDAKDMYIDTGLKGTTGE